MKQYGYWNQINFLNSLRPTASARLGQPVKEASVTELFQSDKNQINEQTNQINQPTYVINQPTPNNQLPKLIRKPRKKQQTK